MPNRAAALLAVLLFGLVACSQSEPLRVGVSAAPVIYGEDDRTEVYAVADPDLRGRAMASAVGIGFRDEFVTVEGETVTVRAGNLAGAANLCSDQTFAGQPSAARCSGLLVEADLVLTAGHCARMIPCDQMLLVLGYYYRAEGELSALTRNDLYACHEVIAKELSPPTSPERLDYAWIRLDHEVRGFDAAPIEVRDRAAPLEAGEPLTMFGFPSGLPLKVDQGGTVVDPRDDTLDYFVASTDSFYGSSGSPLFDASGFLVGVQNRGAPDYVETGAGCNALSRRSEEAGQVEEQATYAARAVDGLCAEDRGQRLCGGQALAPGAACAVRGAGAGANSSRHPTASLALVVLGLVWRRRRGEGSGGKPGHVACVDKSGMVHVLDPPGSMLHTPDDVVVRSDGAIYFSDGDYCPVGTRTGYNAKLPVYLIGVRALGSRVAVLRLRLGRNGDTMRSFAAFCAPRSCPLVLFVAACSSQAPPSYTGEALATLRGAVVADGGATDGGPPAAAKAAVLWYGIRALIGTSSPVQGSFPARFTMSLYAPPPKTLGDPLPPETAAPNFTLDRGPLTLGWIVALAPEANEDDVHPEDVLGYSLDTMIAYVDDTDPRTPKDQVARYAALWQFPPIRGYHLVKIARSDRSAYDQCTWNGLCEDNSTATSIDGFLTFIYSCLHQDYRACVTAMPDAPRCTWYHPGPQDDSFDPKKTNAACIQLEQDFPRRDDCQPPLRHVPNPDEFGSSITITMGSTFRDVFM